MPESLPLAGQLSWLAATALVSGLAALATASTVRRRAVAAARTRLA
jgi:hypothetical protein